jgi:hypothetical protein
MRRCSWAYGSLALGLGLLTGAAEAQEAGEAMPRAPEKMLLAAAPPMSPQAQLSEYGRSLEFIYAEVEELREQRSMSAAEILAVGTGAGVGFAVGAVAAPTLVIPVIAGFATTAGMAAWAGAAGSTAGAMTAVASTWGGSLVGDALID